MSSLSVPSSRDHQVRPEWSLGLDVKLRGLALAREKGTLLVWDENHWLYLLNAAGQRQAQARVSGKLVVAGCAEDGSAFAAVGRQGEVWFLAPDLSARWDR